MLVWKKTRRKPHTKKKEYDLHLLLRNVLFLLRHILQKILEKKLTIGQVGYLRAPIFITCNTENISTMISGPIKYYISLNPINSIADFQLLMKTQNRDCEPEPLKNSTVFQVLNPTFQATQATHSATEYQNRKAYCSKSISDLRESDSGSGVI